MLIIYVCRLYQNLFYAKMFEEQGFITEKLSRNECYAYYLEPCSKELII